MFFVVLTLVFLNLAFAFRELEEELDKRFESSTRDIILEEAIEESMRSGKYDVLLELRIRELLERSQRSDQKEYYSYLLIKYTQDINLLTAYGRYIDPDNLIKLCRDELKTKNVIEKYKKCFEVHKDGRFFRGIYAAMDLRDRETKRWMENKITEVKLYKGYAYHSMGLLYYHLGDLRKAISFLEQSGRLGLASLVKIYINLGDLKRANEYADELRTYRDLTEEEREVLKFVDNLRRSKDY